MEKEQLRIREYLLSKNLSAKLLKELEDHFCKQIEIIKKERKIGFEEAFMVLKSQWHTELRMVKPIFFSMHRIPKIEIEINKKKNFLLMKKSILFSAIIFGLMMLFNNQALMQVLSSALSFSFLIFSGFLLITNRLSLKEILKVFFSEIILVFFFGGFILSLFLVKSTSLWSPSLAEDAFMLNFFIGLKFFYSVFVNVFLLMLLLRKSENFVSLNKLRSNVV